MGIMVAHHIGASPFVSWTKKKVKNIYQHALFKCGEQKNKKSLYTRGVCKYVEKRKTKIAYIFKIMVIFFRKSFCFVYVYA